MSRPLTVEEGRTLLKTGKLPAGFDIQKKKKANKFGAIKKMYNGRLYDSTAEADYSAHLDLISESEGIKKIENQFKIPLISEGTHIANYFIDFKVTYENGKVEYHEFKGKQTSLFKVKWKLAKVWLKKNHPTHELILVMKQKGRFNIVERFVIPSNG